MSLTMTVPGFDNPVHEAQQTFRAILNAFSRPGLPVPLTTVPPALEGEAFRQGLLAVALTLCDANTVIWLDADLNTPAVRHHLRFHCGALLTDDPRQATFAFIRSPQNIPSLDAFACGEEAYPERSTTLVIDVSLEGTGDEVIWAEMTGPGIKGNVEGQGLAVPFAALPERFFHDWKHNHAIFPLGVDVLLVRTVADNQGTHISLLGLPRSVAVNRLAKDFSTEGSVCMSL